MESLDTSSPLLSSYLRELLEQPQKDGEETATLSMKTKVPAGLFSSNSRPGIAKKTLKSSLMPMPLEPKNVTGSLNSPNQHRNLAFTTQTKDSRRLSFVARMF